MKIYVVLQLASFFESSSLSLSLSLSLAVITRKSLTQSLHKTLKQLNWCSQPVCEFNINIEKGQWGLLCQTFHFLPPSGPWSGQHLDTIIRGKVWCKRWRGNGTKNPLGEIPHTSYTPISRSSRSTNFILYTKRAGP